MKKEELKKELIKYSNRINCKILLQHGHLQIDESFIDGYLSTIKELEEKEINIKICDCGSSNIVTYQYYCNDCTAVFDHVD